MQAKSLCFSSALAALLLVCACATSRAGEVLRGVEFARTSEIQLRLDLHRPEKGQAGPLIVWVHGGAWRSGSRTNMPLGKVLQWGYPVASVDYRLSPVARFPAQVHDIKAAIRFLRGRDQSLGIDGSTIVIAGESAGGHLAALVGVSNGHAELEGVVGDHLSENSAVQGIISFFGGANLTTILKQSTPHGLKVREPALDLLLGAQPDAVPELARLASPVFHVDAKDPPLLLLHGDQDPQMPINQAHELDGAYQAAGAPSRLIVVHGAPHGGKMFYDDKRLGLVRAFLAERYEGPNKSANRGAN